MGSDRSHRGPIIVVFVIREAGGVAVMVGKEGESTRSLLSVITLKAIFLCRWWRVGK